MEIVQKLEYLFTNICPYFVEKPLVYLFININIRNLLYNKLNNLKVVGPSN